MNGVNVSGGGDCPWISEMTSLSLHMSYHRTISKRDETRLHTYSDRGFSASLPVGKKQGCECMFSVVSASSRRFHVLLNPRVLVICLCTMIVSDRGRSRSNDNKDQLEFIQFTANDCTDVAPLSILRYFNSGAGMQGVKQLIEFELCLPLWLIIPGSAKADEQFKDILKACLGK